MQSAVDSMQSVIRGRFRSALCVISIPFRVCVLEFLNLHLVEAYVYGFLYSTMCQPFAKHRIRESACAIAGRNTVYAAGRVEVHVYGSSIHLYQPFVHH